MDEAELKRWVKRLMVAWRGRCDSITPAKKYFEAFWEGLLIYQFGYNEIHNGVITLGYNMPDVVLVTEGEFFEDLPC